MEMIMKDINSLTREELLDKEFIPSIYKNYQGEERKEIITEIMAIAKQNGTLRIVKKAIDSEEQNQVYIAKGDILTLLKIGFNNVPECTIDNYNQIMIHDKYITSHVRYNLFTKKFEYWNDNKFVNNWSDANDADFLSYIEKTYGFYNLQKYYQAFSLLETVVDYHPIKEIIENDIWDGTPRIDRFLTDIMGCEDDDYSREVSRMIFYGGISRLYQPGCKFDYMAILMGKQGSCKSTIVNWLALSDSYYREVLTIEGKDGMEVLNGGWICEFSELLAMVRAREVESLKGYITRTVDTFRPAYGRHEISNPRHCIFIGTTNDFEFLVDKTGNRRYLPIEVNLSKGSLWTKEKEVKEYILECWREALHLFRNGETYLVIPKEYDEIVLQHQSRATDDDPKLGIIQEYLSKKNVGDAVCGMEIYTNCFGNLQKSFNRQSSREISMIMRTMQEWKRMDVPIKFENYGRQKYWIKESES